MNLENATYVKATTLTPFHYHSLAVPSGTATLPDFIGDRAMAFAMSSALGCMRQSPILPAKNYLKHMQQLPLLASLFETEEPALMRPLGKRLNIDAESPFSKKIQINTSTGNLKTWFFIQEVPPETTYEGAFFGVDPFELASEEEQRDVLSLTIRIGRHLSGLLRLEKTTPSDVRLNAHTATSFGCNVGTHDVKVERYAMHDLQPTEKISLDKAKIIINSWKNSTQH